MAVKLKAAQKEWEKLHRQAFEGKGKTVSVDRQTLVHFFQDQQALLKECDYETPGAALRSAEGEVGMYDFNIPVTKTTTSHGYVNVTASNLSSALKAAERVMGYYGDDVVEFTTSRVNLRIDQQARKAAEDETPDTGEDKLNEMMNAVDQEYEQARNPNPTESLVKVLEEMGFTVIDDDAKRACNDQLSTDESQPFVGADENDVRQAIRDKMQDATLPLYNVILDLKDELDGRITVPFRAHDLNEALVFAETWRDAYVPSATVTGIELSKQPSEDVPDVAKAA